MYADANGNRVFDLWDVPLLLPVSLDFYEVAQTTVDGTYEVTNVTAGIHTVAVNLPIPAGCTGPSPTWAGEPRRGGCYSAPRFEANPQTVTLAANQTVVVDFIGIPFTTVSGWIWKDGIAPPESSHVAVSVGSRPCWAATTDHHTSAAGVPVTYFEANIASFGDTSCANGDIGIYIDGQVSEFSMTWSNFWRARLHSQSVTFGNSFEQTMVPLFTGVWGSISASAGASTTRAPPEPMPDGTLVRAFVGPTNCGQVETKTLSTAYQTYGNVFGLVVLSDGMRPGCRSVGMAPDFCIGSVMASVQSFYPTLVEPLGLFSAGVEAEVLLTPTSEPCPLGPVALPDTGGRP